MSAGRTGHSPVFHSLNAPADGLGAARQSLALPFAIAASEFGRATLCGANVVFAAGMITNMFP